MWYHRAGKAVVRMDIPALEQLLEDFHRASGMDIAIVDRDFRILARRHSGIAFCSRLHRSQTCLDICMRSDRLQMDRVDTLREMVIYTCPFGIFEALCPIGGGQQISAYLFLSMALEEENARLPLRRALEAAPELEAAPLEKALEKLPRCSRERLEAFARLLPPVAEYIESKGLLTDDNRSLGKLAKDHIKANLDRKITLADLSSRLHCSTVTLTSRFREEFGITVMAYVLDKRMSLARQLLGEADRTISEIAEKCGFADAEYFSKCFRRYHGKSPLAWRKDRKA